MIKHNDSKKHNSRTGDKVRDAGSITKTERSTIAAQTIRWGY